MVAVFDSFSDSTLKVGATVGFKLPKYIKENGYVIKITTRLYYHVTNFLVYYLYLYFYNHQSVCYTCTITSQYEIVRLCHRSYKKSVY